MTHSHYDFVHAPLPSRVVFAAGALSRLRAEIDQLGARKALVLCTPEQTAIATQVHALLGELSAGIYAEAKMHVPIEVARKARAYAQSVGADCAVAVGGGSTIGLGKAIALESALPIVAIPTTYAGSEMTPIYGITEDGIKKTGKDAKVLPRTVIYDPELSLQLPVTMSVVSGLNAMAHAAEALYARDGTPITSLMAAEGLRALAQGLPAVLHAPQDAGARSDCLYGAWLCGSVLGQVGMALHHKLCHTLGGTFNLPHAETHAVVLAHALAYNASHAPEAMQRMAHALGRSDARAATGIYALAQQLGAPTSLKELGMPEDGLARVLDLALQNPYWNPRPLERDALARLLRNAWAGLPPESA